MLKSTMGALTGAVTIGVLVPLACLLLGWIELSSLAVTAIVAALVGLVLGWLRPDFFLGTVLFFLEPDLFE